MLVDREPLLIEPLDALFRLGRDVGRRDSPRDASDRLGQGHGAGEFAERRELIETGVGDDHDVGGWQRVEQGKYTPRARRQDVSDLGQAS